MRYIMENKNEVNILKDAREGLGMTQYDVARLLEVKPQTISNYETARKQPSFENCIKLAMIYQLSLKSLAKHFGFDVSKIPNDED